MKLLIQTKVRSLLFLAGLLTCLVTWSCASLAAPSPPRDPATIYLDIPTKRMALVDAVASGDVSMSLMGDSRTVTHVWLHLANETEKRLDVSVPVGQVFVPEDTSFQYMMVIQPARDLITPASNSEFRLSTVCISPKTVKPPAQSSVYMVGQHPDARHEAECIELVKTAQDLERSSEFDNVPLNPERRSQTIAQLAIWMSQGERSRNPGDKVTRKSIGTDILLCAGKSRVVLNQAERKSFDDFVDKILQAVLLTRKETLKRSISAK